MSDDGAQPENDWEDYDSGPFCRHWGDPSDCDETCARCGERCGKHDDDACEWLERERPPAQGSCHTYELVSDGRTVTALVDGQPVRSEDVSALQHQGNNPADDGDEGSGHHR